MLIRQLPTSFTATLSTSMGSGFGVKTAGKARQDLSSGRICLEHQLASSTRPRCRDSRFTASRVIRAGLVLLMSAMLASCASTVFQKPPGPDAPGNFIALTQPMIAIGDTQEHEPTGFPLQENDSAVDAFVEVTQRPPEQPLFGRRVLEWVINSHPAMPLLHLGDVLDMSCSSEFSRLTRIFQSARQPVAILPGNHDGLMFGIFNYNLSERFRDPNTAKWDHGCRRGGDLMAETGLQARGTAVNKFDFLRSYVSEIVRGPHSHVNLRLEAPDKVQRVSWRNEDPLGYIEAIEGKFIPGKEFSRSFLLQKLRLPSAAGATKRVAIIGLDTNQINTVVSVLDTVRGISPGNFGHVLQDQLDEVERWISQSIASGELVVFAGHHNWAQLGEVTRLRLGLLMAKLPHPLVYISAHTHSGSWAMHQAALNRDLLELNVSSLSDWPISYRRVTFLHDAAANRIMVRAELMPAGDRAPQTDAELLSAWETTACSAAGIPMERIRERDLALVREQKAKRGSLMQWLLESFEDWCDDCKAIMFEHGQQYQNEMLLGIQQSIEELRGVNEQLPPSPHPTFCKGLSTTECADELRSQRATDLASNISLFRRKAALVDWASTQLDRLESLRARAYMTCRAVLATKIDFDITDASRSPGGTEQRRRDAGFFRTEATVGMKL